MLTVKDFMDRIEQEKSSTNTRLANDAFLLILPPPRRICSDTFLDFLYLWIPYEWNKFDECIRRLSNFKLFKSEIMIIQRLSCYFLL